MIESNTTLLIFLGIIGGAFLLQAVGFMILSAKLRSATQNIEQQLAKIVSGTDRTLDLLTDLMTQAKPILATAENVADQVNDLSLHLENLAAETGQKANELAQLARERVQQLQADLDRSFARYEDASDKVQMAILRPTTEVSAVAKGMRTALRHLLRRGPRPLPPVEH